MSYSSFIIKVTGCKEEDTLEIENIMRDHIFHSTLDWQTAEQLTEAAKKAYGLLPLSRITDKVIADMDEEAKFGKQFDSHEKEFEKRLKEERLKLNK
jgi:hypothetical protein